MFDPEGHGVINPKGIFIFYERLNRCSQFSGLQEQIEHCLSANNEPGSRWRGPDRI